MDAKASAAHKLTVARIYGNSACGRDAQGCMNMARDEASREVI